MPETTTNKNTPINKGSPGDPAADELKAAVVAGAHDVKDGLATLTHDAVAQTKKGAESQLTSGKERAAEGLRDVAKALRTASKQLTEDDNETLTGYIDTAASKVTDASDYLRDHSLSELTREVKTFARREPALFLGGALLLGLVGGRFLKSSTPESSASSGPLPTPRAPMRMSSPSQFSPTTQRTGSVPPPRAREPARVAGSSSMPGIGHSSQPGTSSSSMQGIGSSTQPTAPSTTAKPFGTDPKHGSGAA